MHKTDYPTRRLAEIAAMEEALADLAITWDWQFTVTTYIGDTNGPVTSAHLLMVDDLTAFDDFPEVGDFGRMGLHVFQTRSPHSQFVTVRFTVAAGDRHAALAGLIRAYVEARPGSPFAQLAAGLLPQPVRCVMCGADHADSGVCCTNAPDIAVFEDVLARIAPRNVGELVNLANAVCDVEGSCLDIATAVTE